MKCPLVLIHVESSHSTRDNDRLTGVVRLAVLVVKVRRRTLSVWCGLWCVDWRAQ